MAVGAGIGAGTAAATGGNPGYGALYGAAGGGLGSAASASLGAAGAAAGTSGAWWGGTAGGLTGAAMGGAAGGLLSSQFAGSKASGGYAIQEKVKLTPRQERMKKEVVGKIRTEAGKTSVGIYPTSQSRMVVKPIMQAEAARYKVSANLMGTAIGRGARGGTRGTAEYTAPNVGAALGEMGLRVEGLKAPRKALSDMMRANYISSINKWSNIKNIELQVPLLRARAQISESLIGQQEAAERGRTMGNIARLGGLMTMYGRVAKSPLTYSAVGTGITYGPAPQRFERPFGDRVYV
jgi:hypothetical protein